MNRKPISKKIRFEVFKRDSFKCQYCGAEAPNVVLEVDHIKPVSKGGKNTITNLITSCFSCNNGKRATELSDDSVLVKQKTQLDQLQERREQIEMMMNWHSSLLDFEDTQIEDLERVWSRIIDVSFKLTPKAKIKVKSYLRKHGFSDMVQAAKDVVEKVQFGGNDGLLERFFTATLKKANSNHLEKTNPSLAAANYVKGILYNRFTYSNKSLVTTIDDLIREGKNKERIIDAAKLCHSVNRFWDLIDELPNE